MNICKAIDCYLKINQLRSEGISFNEIGKMFSLGPVQTKLLFSKWNEDNGIVFEDREKMLYAYSDPEQFNSYQLEIKKQLEERLLKIVSMRNEGKTYVEIGEIIDRSPTRVRDIFRKYQRQQEKIKNAKPD